MGELFRGLLPPINFRCPNLYSKRGRKITSDPKTFPFQTPFPIIHNGKWMISYAVTYSIVLKVMGITVVNRMQRRTAYCSPASRVCVRIEKQKKKEQKSKQAMYNNTWVRAEGERACCVRLSSAPSNRLSVLASARLLFGIVSHRALTIPNVIRILPIRCSLCVCLPARFWATACRSLFVRRWLQHTNSYILVLHYYTIYYIC